MPRTEVRFSGFGGQGIVRLGLISGKALSLFANKHASMTQSFGPEARGSACSSQIVVSDERVLYPYITRPEILVAMSQEAYDKYEPELKDKGILLIDSDLVKAHPPRKTIRQFSIPSTRFAEELGNRITANLVMLGFFTAVSKIATSDEMKKALPGLVPGRFLDLNIRAFDRGFDHGVKALEEEAKAKPAAKAKPKDKAKAKPKAQAKAKSKTASGKK